MNIQNLILLANLLETFKLFFKQATNDIKVLGPGTTLEQFDNFDFQFSRFDQPNTMGDVLAVLDSFEIEDTQITELILIAARIYDFRDSASWITLMVTEKAINVELVIKGSEKKSNFKSFDLPQTPEVTLRIAKYFIQEVYTFVKEVELHAE